MGVDRYLERQHGLARAEPKEIAKLKAELDEARRALAAKVDAGGRDTKRIKWHYEYHDDLKRIVAVLAKNGIEVTEPEAALLWLCYSNTMSATWLMVVEGYEDDEAIVMRGLKEAMNPMSEDAAWPVGVVEDES